MKESPLIKLVKVRKALEQDLELRKEPVVLAKDSELEQLKRQNQIFAEKIKSNEEVLAKNLTALRYEIENRDKEIFKLKQEISAKEAEKGKALKEISKFQNALAQFEEEKSEMIRSHQQEMADLALKHDQEIYILKKIKKS